MLNKWTGNGRLTRDPELRTTGSGKSVCSFGIAVGKRFKPKDDNEPDADFFNVVAWGQTADFVCKYLTKGRLISVDGRLQQRKYTTQDGQERNVVEIVADSIEGLDRPKDDSDGGSAPAEAPKAPAPTADEYDPFADE